jgi:hypothetical protein
MYFALIYDVTDDYLERRTQYRGEHLALGKAAVERGEIVLGGAFAEPADATLIIFKGEDASLAEAFARDDPYVKNGLVKRWRVRPWNVVLGTAHQG